MAADGAAASLIELGAHELRDRMERGALRAAALADMFLDRIEQLEPEIGAWAWHDPDFVRHQAREIDRHRAAGRPVGALHGLPIGLADLIDAARLPTENGSALDAGRVPGADAYVVARLKQAGAVLAGKTATSELGLAAPAPTRNPHDPALSAGGASAGAAAAVAAGMVPLALGADLGGDAIVAAAFCGVTGYIPSAGAIPRTGILARAPSLERAAILARDPIGAALLGEGLCGHDPADRATSAAPLPQLLATARSKPPLTPVLAVVRPPGWDAETEADEAFSEFVQALGDQCFEVELPAEFADAAMLLDRIRSAEMARNLHRYTRGAESLHAETRQSLARGVEVLARDYLGALDWRDVLYAGLGEILQRADAIVAPAAPGPAPRRPTAGDAACNALWALCGMPSVTLPLMQSSTGLPMGVQLVGARGNDGRLLRTANWLYHLPDA